MKKTIIAVIGASQAVKKQTNVAIEVGKLIAQNNWILVNGGLGGIMEAASRGANEAGGVVVGILPQASTTAANKYVTIPIATNMGHARNAIIAHTADILIAIGGEFGTLSEIAIAKKLGKPVIAIESWDIEGVIKVANAMEAIKHCKQHLR